MIDVVTYLSLARRIASEFFLPGAEREDVEQEAALALLAAAKSYRPELGVPFEAFAKLVIRRRLKTAVRLSHGLKHRALNESLRSAAAVGDDAGDVVELVDTLPSPGADPALIVPAREEALALLDAIAEDLTPLERRVLIGYANGSSYRELSTLIDDVPRKGARGADPLKTIDNAIARARRKLADPFEHARAA